MVKMAAAPPDFPHRPSTLHGQDLCTPDKKRGGFLETIRASKSENWGTRLGNGIFQKKKMCGGEQGVVK